MLIRQITSADAAAYFQLRVQSEQEYPQFVGFNAERELAAGPEGIGTLLESYPAEGTIIFGAFHDSSLLGVAVLSRRLSPKYRHKAFLWGMFVVPAARGGGTARVLMEAAIAWAREQKEIMAISLQVTLSNTRGQQFYRHHGFAVFGTEQRALFAAGQYHGIHYMELELKP